jgi:protein-S-isoprenylcysteine O-methyltransferase Ste14
LEIIMLPTIRTGFFLILWSAPTASTGRLFYNVGLSTYIANAVFWLEEPALLHALGEQYMLYKERVPALFLNLGFLKL